MNPKIFFLDTGYFIALEVSNDKNHTHKKLLAKSLIIVLRHSVAGGCK